MVCLGNICRSPLAHGLLEHKSEHLGLDLIVDSAGTSGYHNGERPDSRSILVARDHGIDISRQVSRKFVVEDFADYDLILAMDSSNYQNILALATSQEDKDKVKLIMNYLYPNQNRKVPDPYYEGGFDLVYDMLDQATDQLIEQELGPHPIA